MKQIETYRTEIKSGKIYLIKSMAKEYMPYIHDKKIRQSLLSLVFKFNQGNYSSLEIVKEVDLILDAINKKEIFDSGNDPNVRVIGSLSRQRSVTIKSLCKIVNQGFRLEVDSLQADVGDIVGIVGENGNGKTTLLDIISHNMSPSSGEVVIYSENSAVKNRDINEYLAYVPQFIQSKIELLSSRLINACLLRGINKSETKERVDYIINRLGLNNHMEKGWSELSGGFQTRFALAEALVWGPKILILDEPLANLDIKSQREFLNDIKNLAKSEIDPVTILMTSQHLFEIESISDKVLFLRNGIGYFYEEKRRIEEEFNSKQFEIVASRMADFEKINIESLEGVLDYNMDRELITVTVDINFNSIELMKFLCRNGVNVISLQDVSQSTRRFFK